MRVLWLVVAVVVVVACRSAPKPEPVSNSAAPPVAVELDFDDTLRERLALGLPLELELRLLSETVGTCTLSFDLWNEVYRVALSRNDVTTARDATLALRRCVDMRRLQELQATGTARVGVHEVPAAKPIPDYPVF